MVFGIQVLGNIIFISALVAALYYLGVIGAVVKVIGGVIGKILGTSKVESFVATANMFLGQTESPILVSKYLKNMSESEIMLVLVSGMGSMSATVLMGYSGMGIPMKYLLIGGALVPLGSIIVSKLMLPENKELKIDESEEVKIDNKGDNPNLISAISQGANDGLGSIIVSKLMLPENKELKIDESEEVKIDNKGDNPNLISAISQGANDGLNMALGIGASLIAILSLVALVNGALGIFGLSLEKIFSLVFAPIGYLMGLDANNAQLAGQLLGSKLVLNEFVAFGQLGEVIKTLDPRTALILSVSLCGFANIGSIGVCISGISVFCPEKRNQLAKLAFRGMIGGFVVSVLSALVVGLIAAI